MKKNEEQTGMGTIIGWAWLGAMFGTILGFYYPTLWSTPFIAFFVSSLIGIGVREIIIEMYRAVRQ